MSYSLLKHEKSSRWWLDFIACGSLYLICYNFLVFASLLTSLILQKNTVSPPSLSHLLSIDTDPPNISYTSLTVANLFIPHGLYQIQLWFLSPISDIVILNDEELYPCLSVKMLLTQSQLSVGFGVSQNDRPLSVGFGYRPKRSPLYQDKVSRHWVYKNKL